MMTTTLHGKALAWAEKTLGETEVPPGSNTGPFVQSCQQATWLSGTRWPWCVAWFQKAWAQTGYRMPWLGAGAYAFLEWAKSVGWAVRWDQAVPGDGVVLNIGAGHMAMLSGAIHHGKVPTISGNYGDKVAAHTFDISQVRGFIHIPADKTVPLPPVKPPMFEVVTSASGKRKVVYVSGATAISKRLGKLLNHYGGITIRRKKP